MELKRDGFHAAASEALPDVSRRILPLIGNDEIKLS